MDAALHPLGEPLEARREECAVKGAPEGRGRVAQQEPRERRALGRLRGDVRQDLQNPQQEGGGPLRELGATRAEQALERVCVGEGGVPSRLGDCAGGYSSGQGCIRGGGASAFSSPGRQCD